MDAVSVRPVEQTAVHRLGAAALSCVQETGTLALFVLDLARWLATRWPRRAVLLHCLHQVGVESLSVVMITGGFIGMVLAVQTYDQFRFMHIEANMGSVINVSLVKELGPVLAATMLAGRVGSAMAAELGTMKITEQIDALRVLGANPVHYLVVPRFIACATLIPLLTIMADVAGVCGGWFLSTQVCGVDSIHYWRHSEAYITWYDLLGGVGKSTVFGAAIAVVGCQRGFACRPGAEGVGRAATESFVLGFVAILFLDLVMGVLLNKLYPLLGLDWTTLI